MSSVHNLKVFKGALDRDVALQAGQEAFLVRDLCEEIEALGCRLIKPDSELDSDDINAPFIGFSALQAKDKTELHDFLKDKVPTFLHTLQTLGGYAVNVADNVALPSTFTINFAAPGQLVPKHRDYGDNSTAGQSWVATLMGRGEFTIFDRHGDYTLPLTAGDICTFTNPATYRERPLHQAVTIGNKTRVSLGTQASIINRSLINKFLR